MRGGARSLRPLDATRLGQAASRPGIDPRSWTMLGRVIEVAFDGGTVIVVTVLEGAIAGEDVQCEVSSSLATTGGLMSLALREGDIAVVVVPNGDPNNMGLVVGYVHEPETPPPQTVNGLAIDAELLGATHVLADVERAVEVEVKNLRLVAEQTKLGPTAEPTQAFVRGNALAEALDSFLEGSTELVTTLAAACVTAEGAVSLEPGLAAFATSMITSLEAWQSAIVALQGHLVPGDALSTHITGE